MVEDLIFSWQGFNYPFYQLYGMTVKTRLTGRILFVVNDLLLDERHFAINSRCINKDFFSLSTEQKNISWDVLVFLNWDNISNFKLLRVRYEIAKESIAVDMNWWRV